MDKPKSIIMFDAVGGNQRVYDAVEADKIFDSLEKKLKGYKKTEEGWRKQVVKTAFYLELKQENQKLREENKKEMRVMEGRVIEKNTELQKLREKLENHEVSNTDHNRILREQEERFIEHHLEPCKAELQKLSKATRENTKHLSDEEVIAMYGKEIAEIIWTN